LRNKGVLLSRLGRLDEARAWLEGEQRRHPDDAGVRRALDELAALPAP
jgi:hypothetical protein